MKITNGYFDKKGIKDTQVELGLPQKIIVGSTLCIVYWMVRKKVKSLLLVIKQSQLLVTKSSISIALHRDIMIGNRNRNQSIDNHSE